MHKIWPNGFCYILLESNEIGYCSVVWGEWLCVFVCTCMYLSVHPLGTQLETLIRKFICKKNLHNLCGKAFSFLLNSPFSRSMESANLFRNNGYRCVLKDWHWEVFFSMNIQTKNFYISYNMRKSRLKIVSSESKWKIVYMIGNDNIRLN